MEFSRQEYWSGLPFSTPGDLPDPGIKLCLSCLQHWQVDSLPLRQLGSSTFLKFGYKKKEREKKNPNPNSLVKEKILPLKKHNLAFRAEKAMTPHSSTLAWKIPWTEEPGRLQSMGSRRVGHD